jgi:predicted membrane protein
MKTEFVALSPIGTLAIFGAGVFVGEAIHGGLHWPLYGILAALLLLLARSDARTPFFNGSYRLGWFAWTKEGEL